jgi:hypothetical protein
MYVDSSGLPFGRLSALNRWYPVLPVKGQSM